MTTNPTPDGITPTAWGEIAIAIDWDALARAWLDVATSPYFPGGEKYPGLRAVIAAHVAQMRALGYVVVPEWAVRRAIGWASSVEVEPHRNQFTGDHIDARSIRAFDKALYPALATRCDRLQAEVAATNKAMELAETVVVRYAVWNPAERDYPDDLDEALRELACLLWHGDPDAATAPPDGEKT